jgi:fibronectin-binding autotransporter adhesin
MVIRAANQKVQLMKTRLAITRWFMVLWSAFATTAVFGQVTRTWTGLGDGVRLANATNWSPIGLLSGLPGDTGQWDGVTKSNLVITVGTESLPNTGLGSHGFDLVLTPNQTNSVQIISSVAVSFGLGVFGITNNSPNSSLTLGDFTANNLRIITRPAGSSHGLVNNSTAPAIINPSVEWLAGGGVGYTYDFSGTGDWIVNNDLVPDNFTSGSNPIQVDGPGTVFWTTGKTGAYAPNSPLGAITINGGALVIKSSGLFTGSANQAIVNNGKFIFDAAGYAQTISGSISGSGLLIVTNNGTLTLSGPSTYTNRTILSGGELIVNGPENGTNGPLGLGGTILFSGGTLGFGVNNVFDYSSRFGTAAGQPYSFDTGGQNVTFATGLTSAGSSLNKIGAGTLTLAGANTYTGSTTVNAGTLVFQGSKSGAGIITVANGATLGVTGNGAQVTPGTLTVGTSSGATLEFNNATSTTTAPMAAGTILSGGTITVNVNSGTFAVGQSYPLLSWTSGTPNFILGTLSGFIGNLSTVGNTLRLNVTGTAYKWTGKMNGDWDFVTSSNWTQNGGETLFAPGGPVLFDDTAPGTTDVIIKAQVQPTAITVNNSSLTYSMTSSAGNAIAGSTGLTKTGTGTLTMAGGFNFYTGVTTLNGGTLSVGALANGGSASDIGAANSGAGNLVLNGTLRYAGSGGSVDRLFTLGTNAVIDSSGSGALDLNNSGSLAYLGNGPRALTLQGANLDANIFAAKLADNGGVTSLTKSGTGRWILTGSNTYSGVTTIAAGLLQVGAGGASGSLGSGNIINNGVLNFNRTGTLSISGGISGTGAVTNDGAGTVVLVGNNVYSGGTTINAGTVQVGIGGSIGTLNADSAVVDNGTLIFNSTAPMTFNAGSTISGTGQLIKRGSGLLKLLGTETYTGGTTIDAFTQLQIGQGNTSSFAATGTITNNGTLILIPTADGLFGFTNNIIGSGNVVKDVNDANTGDTVLLGTNTYTGGTLIRGRGIILGDGFTPFAGTIVGKVVFTNSATLTNTYRWLGFNHPENFTFTNNIVGSATGLAVLDSGAVYQYSDSTVTLTGSNTYPGGTFILAGKLQVGNGGTNGSIGTGPVFFNLGSAIIFNRSDSYSFSGNILQEGSVIKTGAGILTLSGYLGYTGTTTVSNGTMMINGENTAAATFVYGGGLGGTGTLSGPVTLKPGTMLLPGASIGTLTINSNLSIGGNLAIEVNKSLSQSNDFVAVNGALTNTGTGTVVVTNLGPALAVGDTFTLFNKPLTNGAAMTIIGARANWVNNLAVDGSIRVSSIVPPPALNFTNSGNSLQFSWTDSLNNFRLQTQTNLMSTNWVDYPGGATNPVAVPIDPTKGSVFFRLVSP